ncbi:MAG: redoxin domain-containing protein [Methyloprofundus sp.]|nr:redoxin domain-containing protein [Methyloprofundus sp.]
MSYTIGDKIESLSLPALDGSQFNLEQVQGKRYMISFMRFAACPFCQLRIHQLISRWQDFDEDFTVIAVFDSSLENLQKYTQKHTAPFPILADENGMYYQQFSIKYSVLGMLKGMFLRMPTLLYAMFFKGYLPSSIKGKMTTLPADFLVDEKGVINTIYHGKDSGDHMPFEQISIFSKTSTRG